MLQVIIEAERDLVNPLSEEESETLNEAEENTSNKPEEVNQIIKTTEMERMPEKKTEL